MALLAPAILSTSALRSVVNKTTRLADLPRRLSMNFCWQFSECFVETVRRSENHDTVAVPELLDEGGQP